VSPALVPLVLAAIASLPAERSFWVVMPGAETQPNQVEVRARLVLEGTHAAIYQQLEYRFDSAGEEAERAAIGAIAKAFDEVIYARETALYGECPDRDGNGRVLILVTDRAGGNALFFPFDALTEPEAARYGLRSNQGEILYASLEHRGNRARWNALTLTEAFHDLIHHAYDPNDTGWRRLLALYSPRLTGMISERYLWGDHEPSTDAPSPSDPWGIRGWAPLFIQYLRDRLGDGVLHQLVHKRATGFSALGGLPALHDAGVALEDLLADYAMACWLDDATLDHGAYCFRSVVPPRPRPSAQAIASRPSSGVLEVGLGGMVFLVIQGTGESTFPLTLQGDPTTRWTSRAVLVRRRGPDRVLGIAFSPAGIAKLEVPDLDAGDAIVVAVLALPDDEVAYSRRRAPLLWGLGWVPYRAPDAGRSQLTRIVAETLPDKGERARSQILATLSRLARLEPRGDSDDTVTTRYAWAPSAARVPQLLLDEANRRGLPVRVQSFVRSASNGLSQEWSNVLIELPGTDPRRWPVVLAAHWDADSLLLEDAYQQALAIEDNASGVAVALEAAGAISRQPHRVPVTVAFLAGGHHQAAGARALLDHLQGRVSAWIELERVGHPAAWPRTLTVHVEGNPTQPMFARALAQAFRRCELALAFDDSHTPPHTGADLLAGSAVPAIVLTTRSDQPSAAELDLPPRIELGLQSPDLMVLLAKAVSDATVQIAGGERR
jgi:hypothetical protein